MEIFQMILMIFVFHQIVQLTKAECDFVNYKRIISSSETKFTADIIIQSNIGFGFWIRYLPQFQSTFDPKIANNEQRQYFLEQQQDQNFIVKNQAENFICSIIDKKSNKQLLIHQQNINIKQQSFEHEIWLNFEKEKGNLTFTFEKKQYEGVWIMFYIYLDLNQCVTTIAFWQQSQMKWQMQKIQDCLSLIDIVQLQIGWLYYKTSFKEIFSIFKNYFGQFTNVFLTGNKNIYETGIQKCLDKLKVLDYCYEQITSYFQSTQQFFGNSTQSFIRKFVKNQKFVFYGWVKLEPLKYESERETVIFRITINKYYNDDMIIGDRFLYLKYFQNTILNQNGFIFNTYSYDFPNQSKYQTQERDSIKSFDPIFLDLFTQWHVIQFEKGTYNNNGFPLLRIFSYEFGELQYFWQEDLNYFTYTTLQIYFGGDKFSKKFLKGYLSNFNLIQKCSSKPQEVIIECHYSCSTCNGPTPNSCLTCNIQDNREYDQITQSCRCVHQFFDYYESSICYSIFDIQMGIQKYEQQHQELICLIGYVEIDKKCIQCPYFNELKKKQIILCADCLVEPDRFKINLTCTFDYISFNQQSENAYDKIIRDNSQIEIFILNQNNNLVRIKTEVQCLERQYKLNNFCYSCDEGCLKCIDFNTCFGCQKNYYLTIDQFCATIDNCERFENQQNSQLLKCDYCKEGYYLSNNTCLSCGENCQSCNNLKICNFCIDSEKYYVTFDGINCKQCSIKNCKYCFQFYEIQQQIYTTLDFNFQNLSLAQFMIEEGCALCNDGFFFNFITIQCELKCSNLLNTQQPFDCINEFNDCFVGVIDKNGETFCLKSKNYDGSLQYQNCEQYVNCKECFNLKFFNVIEQNYCLLCNEGYYFSIQQELCIPCFDNCKTCFQQNSFQKDFWKLNIYPFYSFIKSNNHQDKFQKFPLINRNNPLELICESCLDGYILYDSKCIKDCDTSCQECQIIDGESKCIKCASVSAGNLRSKQNNQTCIQCPYNCAACSDRTEEEIFNYNPYFRVNQENIFNTRKCFETFENKNYLNMYIDPSSFIIVMCDQFEVCSNKFIYPINVYCNFDDYSSNMMDGQFNVFIDSFFANINNFYYENIIVDILNQESAQVVDMQIKLIKGDSNNCVIQDGFQIYSSIQQRVFFIKQLHLTIFAAEPTEIQFQGQFTIYNFTSVTFSNLHFFFSNPLITYEQLFVINIKALNTSLNINNCLFTTKENIMTIYFSIENILNLMINNLILKDFFVQNSEIFSSKINKIEAKYFQIDNSIFDNSTIFNVKNSEIFRTQQIMMFETKVSNTKFFKSCFLAIQNSFLDLNSFINLNQTILIHNQYIDSILFRNPTNNKFIISGINIDDSIFQQNSIFIMAFSLIMNDSTFKNIQNYQSQLLSNKFQIFENLTSYDIHLIDFEIRNLTFSNISTDNLFSFINLIQHQLEFMFSVHLSLINMYDIKSFSEEIKSLDFTLSSSFIYMECQICIISQAYIERNFGVIEFSIFRSRSIQLSNITVIFSKDYNHKILHPSHECVYQSLLPFDSFIMIFFYQNIFIENFQFTDCIIINKPLIKIQGYDQNYQTLNESIEIINSIFQNNTIVMIEYLKSASIIHINSNQNCQINFLNLTFQGNIFYSFFKNSLHHSSLTLFIDAQFSVVQFKQSILKSNLMLNTSNSILFIKSEILLIENSQFLFNNEILNSSIINNLMLDVIKKDELVYYFPIFSEGGNGKFICSEVSLINIITNFSNAIIGGSFFIQTNSQGFVKILNSSFENTGLSVLNSSSSLGGCFYIDSSQSNLNLILSDSQINNSFSFIGGGIYIIPSKSKNQIVFQNLLVINNFALQSNFLIYQLQFQLEVISEINFENVKFFQTKTGYEMFLSKIEKIHPQSLSNLQKNTIIYITYGNVSLTKLQFNNNYLQTFFYIEKGQKILLKDIVIINCTYFDNPLFSISLSLMTRFNKLTTVQLIIQNMLIENIHHQNQTRNQNYICQMQNDQLNVVNTRAFNTFEKSIKSCPVLFQVNYQVQIIEQNRYFQDLNQLICNQNIIFKENLPYIKNLIKIILNQSHQQLFMSNIIMQNIQCENCLYGIINFELMRKDQKTNYYIRNVTLKNNNCGNFGCIHINQINNNYKNNRILNTDLNNIRYSNFIKILDSQSNNLIIEKSLFSNNIAKFGGSLFINQTSCYIYQCSFLNNQAQKGGAIYIISSNNQFIELIDTLIINNKALIAGGLFFDAGSIGLTQQFNVRIFDNNSTQFGNDISENPRYLTISLDEGTNLLQKIVISDTTQELVEKISFPPYHIPGTQILSNYLMLPSGIQLNKYSIFDQSQLKMKPYKLTFRVIALNKLNQQEKQLNNSFCIIQTSTHLTSNGTEDNSKIIFLSKNKYYFNLSSGDYNMDDLIIYFSPLLTKEYFVRLTIQCNQVLVLNQQVKSNYSIMNSYKQYKLLVDIQTFPCQIGEYLNKNTEGCVLCDANQNLYSLIKNANNCVYRDHTSIRNLTSSSIELKKFYWRAFNQSTKIEFCHNKQDVCLGGWLPGDDSCQQGHIGALCEQCDLYNVRNQGSFSLTSQFSCSNCSNILKNSFIIFVILVWLVVTLYTSVNSTAQKNKEFILTSKFRFTIFSESFQHAQQAILIKLFTNYFQLISSIQSFQIQIPEDIAFIQQSLGNPVNQASYSFDCFLVYFTIVDANYFRIMWMILEIFIIVLVFAGLGIVDSLINRTQFQTFKISIAMTYLFLYLQPSIIGSLIAQLSYRNISDIKWISGNPAYIYDTPTHLQWMIYFIIPFTLIFGLFIPLFLFLKLYFNKNRLYFPSIRQNFGYLINEYKQNAYYWDLIKLFQKQFIIQVLTYYQDYVAIKASLVVLLLFIYCLIQVQIKPYLSHSLNELDGQIMKICAYSLILGSCIYSAQSKQIEIVWLSYLIISSINIIFSILFIIKILKALFQQIDLLLERLKSYAFFYCPLTLHSKIQKYLFNKAGTKQVVKNRFLILKKKLLPYIKEYINLRKILFNNSQSTITNQRQYQNFFTYSDEGISQMNAQLSSIQPEVIKLFFTKSSQKLTIKRKV